MGRFLQTGGRALPFARKRQTGVSSLRASQHNGGFPPDPPLKPQKMAPTKMTVVLFGSFKPAKQRAPKNGTPQILGAGIAMAFVATIRSSARGNDQRSADQWHLRRSLGDKALNSGQKASIWLVICLFFPCWF